MLTGNIIKNIKNRIKHYCRHRNRYTSSVPCCQTVATFIDWFNSSSKIGCYSLNSIRIRCILLIAILTFCFCFDQTTAFESKIFTKAGGGCNAPKSWSTHPRSFDITELATITHSVFTVRTIFNSSHLHFIVWTFQCRAQLGNITRVQYHDYWVFFNVGGCSLHKEQELCW